MNKTKYAIIAVLVSLAVIVGVANAGGSFGGLLIEKIAQIAGLSIADNINSRINESLPELSSAEPSFGAMPGNELPGPCFIVGGFEECSYSGTFQKATTTLFAVKSPNATTSLVFASMLAVQGTSTAATWVIASSTDAYSTSSASNITSTVFSIAANAQDGFTWMPQGGSVRDSILPPSTWILGKTEGAGLGGYTYGTSSAWKIKLVKLQ